MSEERQSVPSAPWEHPLCTDPIHHWFGLSYANYLVIPRTLLQSLSREAQIALCRALDMAYAEEAANMQHHWPLEANIEVKMKDCVSGRYVADPYANYERGRRRLWKTHNHEIPKVARTGHHITQAEVDAAADDE
jgi:hypothetical protein